MFSPRAIREASSGSLVNFGGLIFSGGLVGLVLGECASVTGLADELDVNVLRAAIGAAGVSGRGCAGTELPAKRKDIHNLPHNAEKGYIHVHVRYGIGVCNTLK